MFRRSAGGTALPGTSLRGATQITDRMLEEFLAPDDALAGGRGGPELPLVVLLGPRGSGKSAVLQRMQERCREHVVPVARLDLDGREQTSPGHVASALAFALAQRLDGVPSPFFPRLLLGQLVLDAELDRGDPARARKQIELLLRNRRERHDHAWDSEGMSEVLGLLPAANGLPVTSSVAMAVGGLAVRGLELAIGTSKKQHRAALDWYGRDTADPRDALATLHRYWHDGDPNERRSVDEAQCGAFLADMRAYRAERRSRVCVALLDNADSPAGAGFLDTLIRVREAWDMTGPRDRDSLLIVATSRRRPRAWSAVAPSEDQVPPRLPDQAGHADWAGIRRELNSDGSWWYPVLLRGFGLGDLDAVAAVETRRARADAPERAATLTDLTAAVHRATGGHPWAVRAVIGAVLNRDGDTSRADALRRSLDRPVHLPGGDHPDPDPLTVTAGEPTSLTLGEYALDRMLRGAFEPPEVAALTGLAAAWDPHDSAELGRWAPMTGLPQLYQKLKDHLWLVEDAPGDPRRRPNRGTVAFIPQPGRASHIHPWLRTLLLHRLARGGGEGDGADPWRRMHQELRQDYQREAATARDEAGRRRLAVRALHHQLAADGLGDPVAHLIRRWDDRDIGAAAWLEDFNALTAAPNRLPRLSEPRVVLDQLTAPAADLSELHRLLWRLTAARWLLCDPMADPAGDLRGPVGDLLRTLGAYSRAGFQLFYDEADKYR